MALSSKLKGALLIARQRGLGNMLRYTADLTFDVCYEHWLSAQTSGDISTAALGISDADAFHYAPTPYSCFFRAMKKVDARDGVFVDYGSGKGRIVCSAARYPFRKVIGVEFSERLVAEAHANIARARRRLLCKDIELVTANAAGWSVPDDATVFHFYNPFGGQTLLSAIGKIAESMRRSPRQVWLMFAFLWHIAPIMAADEPIPRRWQKATSDVLWPPYDERNSDNPNGHRHRIYTLDSR